MQNRTIIRIDSIAIISISILVTTFHFISPFIVRGEIFMGFDATALVGTASILLYAISALLVSFEHSLSARVIMVLGFVALVVLIVSIIAFIVQFAI